MYFAEKVCVPVRRGQKRRGEERKGEGRGLEERRP
jgi:hypothetical protein